MRYPADSGTYEDCGSFTLDYGTQMTGTTTTYTVRMFNNTASNVTYDGFVVTGDNFNELVFSFIPITINAGTTADVDYSFVPTVVGAKNFMVTLENAVDADPDCQLQIMGTASVNLPIELIDFRGDAQDGGIKLTWETATEQNNDYMVVERSRNGIRYEEIGQVKGAGTSQAPQQYAFIDRLPLPGSNYYRLKQVDFDGSTEYHKVIIIEYQKEYREMVVYPSDAREMIHLNISKSLEEDATVHIFDLQGRRLHSGVFEAGRNQMDIELNRLPAGQYVLHLQGAEFRETARFSKVAGSR